MLLPWESATVRKVTDTGDALPLMIDPDSTPVAPVDGATTSRLRASMAPTLAGTPSDWM